MTAKTDTHGLRHLPRPSEVSYQNQANQHRIRWDKVEPWLQRVKDQGALEVLAKALQISKSSVYARREEMGLPGLPLGRPPTVTLTEYEAMVICELETGTTQEEIAERRGVSQQAISAALKRAECKIDFMRQHCGQCGGAGVRPCGSDGEEVCHNNGQPIPKHAHICLHCGGRSTYNANPTR